MTAHSWPPIQMFCTVLVCIDGWTDAVCGTMGDE